MTNQKRFYYISGYAVLLLAGILLFSCKGKVQDHTKDRLSVVLKTTKDSSGWGYEVYVDNKLFIKQPVIPAVPGNHAFFTEADAKLTGNLVVKKITHGEQPFITQEELHQLNITFP